MNEIAAAYLAEIEASETGIQHLPGIKHCARQACRLGRITTKELTAILRRLDEREAELKEAADQLLIEAAKLTRQKLLF